MIDKAIAHLVARLNDHFDYVPGSGPPPVVASSLLDLDGSAAPNVDSKLVVFLTNVAKDTTARTLARRSGAGTAADALVSVRPPISFNLFVMVAVVTQGEQYSQGLAKLSRAIEFFQANPVLDQRSSPGLDRRIERLALDIENLDISDLGNLWGVLSGRYLPSVLYRVRMLTFDTGAVTGRPAVLREPELKAGS